MCFTSRKKIVSRVYTALQNYIEDFQLFFFSKLSTHFGFEPLLYIILCLTVIDMMGYALLAVRVILPQGIYCVVVLVGVSSSHFT